MTDTLQLWRCPKCRTPVTGRPNKKFCGSPCRNKHWLKSHPRVKTWDVKVVR